MEIELKIFFFTLFEASEKAENCWIKVYFEESWPRRVDDSRAAADERQL